MMCVGGTYMHQMRLLLHCAPPVNPCQGFFRWRMLKTVRCLTHHLLLCQSLVWENGECWGGRMWLKGAGGAHSIIGVVIYFAEHVNWGKHGRH